MEIGSFWHRELSASGNYFCFILRCMTKSQPLWGRGSSYCLYCSGSGNGKHMQTIPSWLLYCHMSLWCEAERKHRSLPGRNKRFGIVLCGALWRYPSLFWKTLTSVVRVYGIHESDGWRVNQQNLTETKGAVPDCNIRQSLVKNFSIVWIHLLLPAKECQNCIKSVFPWEVH